MKKVLAFSVIIVCLLFSCKKDPTAPQPVNDGPGTISAVIDGQTHNFNYGDNNPAPKAWLEYIQVISSYRFVVYGQVENGYFEDHIAIEITSPDPIVPGSYSLSSASNTSPHIFYCPATVPFQNCHGSVNGIITITEMNSSYVKGTFNGMLSYRDNSGTPRSNTLSNGKFNVSF